MRLMDVTAEVRKNLMMDGFGTTSISDVKMKDLKLPLNPCRTLSKTKLESLSQKYFLIPKTFIKYYTVYVPEVKKSKSKKKKSGSAKRKKNNNGVARVKKRRVGRPKKEPMIPEGARSITAYFRSE